MPNFQSDSNGLEWLEPEWSAPAHVRAVSTTRLGGMSAAPHNSLNLAGHVGDDKVNVSENRRRLIQALEIPAEPVWLNQVHGCGVAELSNRSKSQIPIAADAAWTDRPGEVCVVMTADCLPLLICDEAGTQVATVHAGWRGLCEGVIEAALARFHSPTSNLHAWLGPAIGPDAFEVGPEVRAAFLALDAAAGVAFRPGQGDKWFADIFALARQRLRKAGIEAISGGGHCTFSDEEHFFSYRRDGVTGRMATLIWIEG
ncbi:MAG: peptidoglycan editing factor PgeF [Gammaproteobacteria bacterium]|nr:peptidoglycan editing factor PgeF [Gammaproteobacteria bacterium]MBU1653531.1 peptidoglycan editing factor PgeF [Gammaproteobacteria bacterium]MBU1961653.1 peptidoglycan editing factor PgeF [Gammaproteobacteria bacterium]